MSKTLANMNRAELLRRLEEIEHELDERLPLVFAEYKLVQRALLHVRDGDKPYAMVRWPREAILRCLERNQKWMTRRQIRRDLELGGFSFDPATFDNLLADALRYHTSKGVLARRDEHGKPIKMGHYPPGKKFPNERYGLAGWDSSVPSLEEQI